MFVPPPPGSYVEPNPNVMVFGGRALGFDEVLEVEPQGWTGSLKKGCSTELFLFTMCVRIQSGDCCEPG